MRPHHNGLSRAEAHFRRYVLRELRGCLPLLLALVVALAVLIALMAGR